MSRSVPWLLFGSAVVAALVALAGCSHYLSGEREAWRGEAEAACLNSGAVKEGAERVRISAIEGPGICGADYPLRVSALGESAPLGYDDEPLRPPGTIPDAALPPRWPVASSNGLPPPLPPPIAPRFSPAQYGPPPSAPAQSGPPQNYPLPASQQAGAPMSLYPPGVSPPEEDDSGFRAQSAAALRQYARGAPQRAAGGGVSATKLSAAKLSAAKLSAKLPATRLLATRRTDAARSGRAHTARSAPRADGDWNGRAGRGEAGGDACVPDRLGA